MGAGAEGQPRVKAQHRGVFIVNLVLGGGNDEGGAEVDGLEVVQPGPRPLGIGEAAAADGKIWPQLLAQRRQQGAQIAVLGEETSYGGVLPQRRGARRRFEDFLLVGGLKSYGQGAGGQQGVFVAFRLGVGMGFKTKF